MGAMTREGMSEKMGRIDFGMRSTRAEGGAQVGLTFTGAAGLLGGPPLFIAVKGNAALIRVHADRVQYRNGSDEGEVAL